MGSILLTVTLRLMQAVSLAPMANSMVRPSSQAQRLAIVMLEPIAVQPSMELVRAHPMCCCMVGQVCQLVLVTFGVAPAVYKTMRLNLGISQSGGGKTRTQTITCSNSSSC